MTSPDPIQMPSPDRHTLEPQLPRLTEPNPMMMQGLTPLFCDVAAACYALQG